MESWKDSWNILEFRHGNFVVTLSGHMAYFLAPKCVMPHFEDAFPFIVSYIHCHTHNVHEILKKRVTLTPTYQIYERNPWVMFRYPYPLLSGVWQTRAFSMVVKKIYTLHSKKTNFGPGHLFLLHSMYKQNIYLHRGLKLNWSSKLKNFITLMLIIYLIEHICLSLLLQHKKDTWFNPSYQFWWKYK